MSRHFVSAFLRKQIIRKKYEILQIVRMKTKERQQTEWLPPEYPNLRFYSIC